MPLSTSFDNSLEESNSYLEFKYPQDTRFRLRTTDCKISDQDLTDAGPSNANLEQKFGNVKKCHKISGEKLVFRCEDCNRDFKKEKGLKIHRSRIHGLMSQSFSSKSFSSEINKTRRITEEINNTPFNSTDYEKQFGSQDNHSSGPQRLNCNLCHGKSFEVPQKYEPHLRDEHIYH
jgi:Zn finger protein HypA/HybF involved in hydrogenase expression